MNILIIGSQGFIGSKAYDFFSQRADHIAGADIVEHVKGQNFFNLAQHGGDISSLLQQYPFDFCLNASGNGSVPVSLENPLLDYELNTTNTIRFLEAIRLHAPACKFINLSSAAVYGNPAVLPVSETAIIAPLSPYGWHKYYAEQICVEYYRLHAVRTVNLRLFSIYGAGLRKQLFWDLYQKCEKGNEIELFGTGSETRDFIYIDDLMFAFVYIMDNAVFEGEAINVASGNETSISEAAHIFCRAVNESLDIRFNHRVKPGDPLNWRADISILKGMGFTEKTSIHEGLNSTVQWLKEKK